MELFNRLKVFFNQSIFFIQLHWTKLMLVGFGVLIEAFLAIGDVTIFMAFPESFIPALIIGLLFVLKDKLKPVIYKEIIQNRFALTIVLFSFSITLYLNFFEWIQPF
ncbi:hypothetical protein [Rummeliibacillus suwonensis]|uniref:hypothetical protein n=1 Tax=Rummeliibacillus suwonensis TaxID=1306154 RepID=UPI0011B69C58|nr:hypothetical protein [Rummeliibacillus suwonensis]